MHVAADFEDFNANRNLSHLMAHVLDHVHGR